MLRNLLLSRIRSRLSRDAYRVGCAASASSVAALFAAVATLPDDDDKSFYEEQFKEAADVLYEGATAINGERPVRVRLYCTWTERTIGDSTRVLERYYATSLLEGRSARR